MASSIKQRHARGGSSAGASAPDAFSTPDASRAKASRPAASHTAADPTAASSTAASPAADAAAVARRARQSFFRLSLAQIACGLAYAAAVWLALHRPELAAWRAQARWFVELQHTVPGGLARAGPRDACYLVTAFVGVMTARAAVQLAAYALVARRRDLATKAKIRFTEQAWCLVYYGGAAAWGLLLLRSQPYGWDAARLWAGFPHYFIDGAVKRYYLTLFGYWLSQLVVIHLEDRRKDHWQMFTHHVVTCALILGSFAYSYTRIGHLVLIMMDTVDVFLSLAKCTKYLRAPTMLTDAIFLVFLVSWVLLRHFLYMYEILYAAFPLVPYLQGRCAYVDGAPVQCFSLPLHRLFFALTLALQAIILMWLVLIVKVVMRVVRGEGAADNRSDSED